MSQRIKRIAGAVVFFLLLVFVVGWIQNLVTPKYDWPEHNRRSLKSIASAFNEPKNSLDVIFLGTSQTFCGISPMHFYDNGHIRSYNLASIGQRIPVAYYMLRGLLRRQSPKLVVIDASGFFYTEDELGVSGKWEEIVDSLPMSCYREKLDMIRDIAQRNNRSDDREYLLSALIPLLRYHSDYHVEKESFQKLYINDLYQRKGYVATYRFEPVDETEIRTANAMLYPEDTFADDDDAREMLADCITANEPYLRSIKEMCEAHGAKLAVMKVPVCANTRARGYWSINKHELTQALAERLGVEFLDMSYEDLGLDWRKDSFDGGVHLNHRGAQKICARLLQWMQTEYGIESEKNEKLDSQWAYQSELFAEEMEYNNLELEYDLIEFLDHVQRGNYTLFTTVSNGIGDYWSDEAQRKLEEVTGTGLDLRDEGNAAYLSISCGGEIIEERHDERTCSLNGALKDGLRYDMNSKTGEGKKNGRISIWGSDYATPGQGVHFVVYDARLGCIVASLCFNTNSPELEATQEPAYQYVMRERLIEFVHDRMKKM